MMRSVCYDEVRVGLACYDEVRVGHLLVCCVVFFCPACYDEVRVGHLFSFLCCILLSCLL